VENFCVTIIMDPVTVNSAVSALIAAAAKHKSTSLFLDAPARLLLNISAFKTPSGAHHYYNIVLPHSPHGDVSISSRNYADILFIVKDVKGEEPERTVSKVRDTLRSSGVKIREILTLKQLRDEYSSFESKRALAKSVDVVIAEQAVFKIVPRILGREFQKRKKLQLAIPGRKMRKGIPQEEVEEDEGAADLDDGEEELGKQIEGVLKKTVLNLSLKGKTSSLVIGYDNLTASELVENIDKVANWLKKKFPGGWANVEKLSLVCSSISKGMPPLTIYMSTGSANDVQKPPVTKGGLEGSTPETGELSTLPGSTVRVHPTGQVDVIRDQNLSAEDKELVDALVTKQNNRGKKRKLEVKPEVKEEDSDEDAQSEEESEEESENEEEEDN